MKHTAQDILNYVEDNDVKFVRLAFCDIFGNQKNISVFAGDLPYAFEQGVCFDGSSIAGFMNTEESDLVLWPDPDTMTILPWRPTEGRVMRMYCDITLPNGRPFAGNSRGYLQSVVKRTKAMGLRCDVGCECEFYLFQTDEHGNPTRIPMDHGGYFDIAPLDKAENIRREICFAMEDMGLRPQHSHHESGFGQNEVDFMYSTALKSADNLNTFKSTVKAIADRNGLFASFMPKPMQDQAGSGMHVNVSIHRDGKNLFQGDIAPDSEAGHFVAGILAHARELTAFCNPVPNSYARLGANEGEVRLRLCEMMVCDSILANADRHWRNFGFIRNVDTLELRPAPIFDTGNCLWYAKTDGEVAACDWTFSARPFGPEPQRQLSLVDRAEWFEPAFLDGFVEEAMGVLARSAFASTPERVPFIEEGLSRRVAAVSSVMEVLAFRQAWG